LVFVPVDLLIMGCHEHGHSGLTPIPRIGSPTHGL